MKNFLVTLLFATITLGSWASNNAKNDITTVRTNIPVRLYMINDSTFNVESNNPYVVYSITNDSVLKINYKGTFTETEKPIVIIKTPKKLKVETARFLKVQTK
jgi:hypothetical protein